MQIYAGMPSMDAPAPHFGLGSSWRRLSDGESRGTPLETIQEKQGPGSSAQADAPTDVEAGQVGQQPARGPSAKVWRVFGRCTACRITTRAAVVTAVLALVLAGLVYVIGLVTVRQTWARTA